MKSPLFFAFVLTLFSGFLLNSGDGRTVHEAPAQTVVSQVDPAPGVQLEAPLECEVGELVRFDARNSDVDSLVWDIIPKTDDFEQVDGGRRSFFSARSGGEYLILIAGAKGGQAFLVHQRLIVKGDSVPNTGMTLKVENWLKLLPAIPDRDQKLKTIAGVFEQLSQKPVEPEKMVEATALANSAVLGSDVEQWIPFFDKLGIELDMLVDSGQLETSKQYQKTWAEIAQALYRNIK